MEEKHQETSRAMAKARKLSDLGHPKTDPQGSWTGQPADPYEVPVQDADDL